jgi:DNA repair photolyase
MRDAIPFTVEKNRVLVPVGEPCRFGCRYCYTRGGEVGRSRLKIEDILSNLQNFAQETSFETIQFGYDSDPFARPERGLSMLNQLALLHKHVNFSTKALLEGTTLDALTVLRRSMEASHTVLSALISFSCWDSAPIVEPHTPTPSERIRTVANLKNIGMPVFIAMRPILPHIPDYEYEHLIDEGIQAGCNGFILGPLYSDARGRFVRFLPSASLVGLSSQTGRVAWSAHKPLWTRYEDTERLQKMLALIARKGGAAFLSSVDALALVDSQEASV